MKLKSLSLAIMALSFSPVSFAWTTDIPHHHNKAYVQDSDHNIVRDRWGRCVRTIEWKKDIAIAKCEGWPEPAPKVVEAPKPAPAPVVEAPKAAPAITAPLAFSGFFKTNKADLTQKATEQLDDYVNYLNKKPNATVSVKGYTDSRGAASYNQQLSQKRAEAVKAYLESKGIAANRITAEGLGEANPIADNATSMGRSQNRRVELQVSE